MSNEGRVVTAKLPNEIVAQMDEVAARLDRSKSWIVRQAVDEWLVEEQLRHELTLEALKDVAEGRTFSHEEVLAMAKQCKRSASDIEVPRMAGRWGLAVLSFALRNSI